MIQEFVTHFALINYDTNQKQFYIVPIKPHWSFSTKWNRDVICVTDLWKLDHKLPMTKYKTLNTDVCCTFKRKAARGGNNIEILILETIELFVKVYKHPIKSW